MKKNILLLFILIISKLSFGQTDTTLLYLRFPFVPSFKLINIKDSTLFTKDNLLAKKPTVVIIFSPDCEHCQAETKSLLENINLFKKAQIIMASPIDFKFMKAFYEEYKIADFPNITMGRDPNYYLGTFYKIRNFPAIFIYDKKGRLITNYSGSVPVQQIATSLKLPSPYK